MNLINDKITTPEVSVILTVYNREELLKRCIDSLLNQSYTNWELIAVDDGSDDNSLKNLKNYEKKFDNIKVFHQDNIKTPKSRNRGIKYSSGKYITFLDSDDEYEKDHLKKRISFMKENPELDLIHGGARIIGNQFVRDKDNPSKFIHLSKCSICGTFFGKREVFVNLNGFEDINYSSESYFLLKAEEFFNVKKVNFETYIYHREIKDSITYNFNPAVNISA